MKKIAIIGILLLATGMQAQKNAANVKQVTKITNLATCYTGKTWVLVKVERFGVEKPPAEEEKGDMLQLNADNTFVVKIAGVEKKGKYTRSGNFLNLKAESGESFPFKIISCEGNILKTDYRDGDTHNNFEYNVR